MKSSFLLLLFLLSFLYFSCHKNSDKDFIVQGHIKGLTKGTLYLEKIPDAVVEIVDSFVVRDDGKFRLGDLLISPEIYFLRIKEIPDKKLLIFGEKGEVNITSKLEKFVVSAKVTGSENHDLLLEYKKMIARFNEKYLHLFKAGFEAERAMNPAKVDSLNKVHQSLLRRRYLYTANFAVRHSDKEIAPYLALTELYNATIPLLDTVNNSLTSTVKVSKYGKKLANFISDIKKSELKKD